MASASSISEGAGSKNSPDGCRVSVPARNISSTGPVALASAASEFTGVRLRKAATSPRWRSRSTSAVSASSVPWKRAARFTASVVAPSPPRTPTTVSTVPAAWAAPGLVRSCENLMSALCSSWLVSGSESTSVAPASRSVRSSETPGSSEAAKIVSAGRRSWRRLMSAAAASASAPTSTPTSSQRRVRMSSGSSA